MSSQYLREERQSELKTNCREDITCILATLIGRPVKDLKLEWCHYNWLQFRSGRVAVSQKGTLMLFVYTLLFSYPYPEVEITMDNFRVDD